MHSWKHWGNTDGDFIFDKWERGSEPSTGAVMPGHSAELWFAASLPDIISVGKWRNKPLPLRCPKCTLTSDVRLSAVDCWGVRLRMASHATVKLIPLSSRHHVDYGGRRPSPFTLHGESHKPLRETEECGVPGGRRRGGGLIRPDLHRPCVPHTIPSVPIHLMFWEIILRPLEKREESEQ